MLLFTLISIAGALDGASWDSLLSDLSLNESQHQDDDLSDVTFIVQGEAAQQGCGEPEKRNPPSASVDEGDDTVVGKRFQAHRLLLSLRSPVFRAMFNGPMKEAPSKEITVTDVTPEAFAAMLAYLYRGGKNASVALSEYFTSPSSAWQLWYAARKYMLDSLENRCRRVNSISCILQILRVKRRIFILCTIGHLNH